MRPHHLDHLVCPACYTPLRPEVLELRGEIVWSAALHCSQCLRTYPLRNGIAYLSVVDRSWLPMLKETVARRDLVQGQLEGLGPGGLGPRRYEIWQAQEQEMSQLMGDMFRQALAELDFTRSLRVLEIGAGMCHTSAILADRGADVVASEVDYANLQYVDFKGEGGYHEKEDPNRPFPLRNPLKFEHYFSRVCCTAHRLPFADGYFDAVVCRAMLHHLENLPAALQEMTRVCASGGRLLFVAEPVRGILDRERDQFAESIEFQEGMNEHMPLYLHYARPLDPFCSELEFVCYDSRFRPIVRKALRLLGRDPDRFISPGSRLRGCRRMKLLLAQASLTISGTRNNSPAASAPPLTDRDLLCAIEDLLAISSDDDADAEIAQFAQKTEAFRRLVRVCLDPRRLPVRLRLAKERSADHLGVGWRVPERAHGRRFRYFCRRATCYLRRRPHDISLVVTAGGIPAEASRVVPCTVLVNGREIGGFDTRPGVWEEHRFALGAFNGARPEEVVEVELRAPTKWSHDQYLHNGDERELGLGIHEIRCQQR